MIHVIDVTHPCWQKQEQSVLQTLRDMDAGHKPMVRVFNKIDQLTPEQAEEWKYEAAGMNPMSVAVSAITGDGMQDFVAVVEDALSTLLVSIEVEIPFSKGEELNLIHEVGAVDIIDYRSTPPWWTTANGDGRLPRISIRLLLARHLRFSSTHLFVHCRMVGPSDIPSNHSCQWMVGCATPSHGGAYYVANRCLTRNTRHIPAIRGL